MTVMYTLEACHYGSIKDFYVGQRKFLYCSHLYTKLPLKRTLFVSIIFKRHMRIKMTIVFSGIGALVVDAGNIVGHACEYLMVMSV